MPETKEIEMPGFDTPPQMDHSLFVGRDGDYRKRKRDDRMRKRGFSNEHDASQSSAVIDEEEYTTAELKSAESKGQNGGPERPEPQSFLNRLIMRKNQVLVYLVRLPRINL